MNELKKLLHVADTLMGPHGCPWDREQTFFTLQTYLLEEAHELIEAIDLQDVGKIKEELGDLLYVLVFLAKMGEKEGKFTLANAAEVVTEKLIRRHPHVFDKLKVESTEEIMRNWEEIKKKEGKKNPFDGIPPTLPALARAQKVIAKLRRVQQLPSKEGESSSLSEGAFGEKLWDLVKQA